MSAGTAVNELYHR